MSKWNVSSLLPPRIYLCTRATCHLTFKPCLAWNCIVPILNIYSMHRQTRVTQEPQHPQGQGSPEVRGQTEPFSRVTLGLTENQTALGTHLGGCCSRIQNTAQAGTWDPVHACHKSQLRHLQRIVKTSKSIEVLRTSARNCMEECCQAQVLQRLWLAP